MIKRSKSAKSFFRLLVASSALIITASLVMFRTNLFSEAHRGPRVNNGSVEYSFVRGWNMFSLPLEARLKASTVCSMLDGSLMVARLDSSSWTIHDCTDDTHSFDFEIKDQVGYAVKVSDRTKWILEGKVVGPKTPRYKAGLTLTGVPFPQSRLSYANSFCAVATDDNLEVDSVHRWDNGFWDRHDCDTPEDNNFITNVGEAFIVSVTIADSDSQVRIPALP